MNTPFRTTTPVHSCHHFMANLHLPQGNTSALHWTLIYLSATMTCEPYPSSRRHGNWFYSLFGKGPVAPLVAPPTVSLKMERPFVLVGHSSKGIWNLQLHVSGYEITEFPGFWDTQKHCRKPNIWTRVSDWTPCKNQCLDALLPFGKPQRDSETHF